MSHLVEILAAADDWLLRFIIKHGVGWLWRVVSAAVRDHRRHARSPARLGRVEDAGTTMTGTKPHIIAHPRIAGDVRNPLRLLGPISRRRCVVHLRDPDRRL